VLNHHQAGLVILKIRNIRSRNTGNWRRGGGRRKAEAILLNNRLTAWHSQNGRDSVYRKG
jgi:hypothetical protein